MGYSREQDLAGWSPFLWWLPHALNQTILLRAVLRAHQDIDHAI